MSKIAFIYPGQGAQKAGMGADFYENSEIARYIFDQAGEELDLDMKELCFEENDRLDLTEYTQAAMVTTCLAMTRVAESKGLKADITAGLSLGEYPAIAAAGGMNDMDAIRLVRKRGILMQNTVPAGEGAMCAVISMAAEEIEKVIEPIADVSVANYNCPGQIVITGKTDAVEEAAAKLKEAGARRTIMLNVSGPFHSQMLVPAGEKLAEELEHTRFHELRIPYVTNVTAEKVTDIRETPGLLTTQISSPVRWMQSMERMIADGVDTFVEIGPGKTLEGFLRKIDRSVKVFHISQWEDVDKVCDGTRRWWKQDGGIVKMDQTMEGKVAVVTGASRGIGKAIAVKLASKGATVVINYNGSRERAEEVKNEVESAGGKAVIIQCNVADFDACKEFIETVIKEQGRIDILVNNAGITKDGLLMKMSEEDFDKVLDTNLKGTFHTIRAALRQMIRQRSGRIINMASVVGVSGNAGQANYAASKAGVIGLTKTAAREVASRGITVNAVAPGFIETDMTEVLPEKIKEASAAQIPLGKFGKAEDVANAVAFLASEDAGYITGQVLHVDGGMVM